MRSQAVRQPPTPLHEELHRHTFYNVHTLSSSADITKIGMNTYKEQRTYFISFGTKDKGISRRDSLDQSEILTEDLGLEV